MGLKFKVSCEAVGDVFASKNGHLRKFLVEQNGTKEIITVFSKNETELNGKGLHERVIEAQDFFFCPKGK